MPAPPFNNMPSFIVDPVFGNKLLITARQPRAQQETIFRVDFEGFSFVGAPNVLLTSMSPHFISSVIWVSNNSFGLVANKVSEPGSPQSFDIQLLVHGTLTGTASALQTKLTSVLVANLDELIAMAPAGAVMVEG